MRISKPFNKKVIGTQTQQQITFKQPPHKIQSISAQKIRLTVALNRMLMWQHLITVAESY
jgi:hypothetical protein